MPQAKKLPTRMQRVGPPQKTELNLNLPQKEKPSDLIGRMQSKYKQSAGRAEAIKRRLGNKALEKKARPL